jgi:hypothetical protein
MNERIYPAGNGSPALDRIEAHLLSQLGGRVRDLQVSLRDDGIVLRGHAHSYYVKQLAQHAAAELSGLPIIANEIDVR